MFGPTGLGYLKKFTLASLIGRGAMVKACLLTDMVSPASFKQLLSWLHNVKKKMEPVNEKETVPCAHRE